MQEKEFDYKSLLPIVWGKAKGLWGEEAETRVHAFTLKHFNKDSLTKCDKIEFDILIEWLNMNLLEHETPLDFKRFGETDYVEKWVATRCAELKKSGTLKPLEFLWALYKPYYVPKGDCNMWYNTFCWHVANRINTLRKEVDAYKNPTNSSHKKMVESHLLRIAMLQRKAGWS